MYAFKNKTENEKVGNKSVQKKSLSPYESINPIQGKSLSPYESMGVDRNNKKDIHTANQNDDGVIQGVWVISDEEGYTKVPYGTDWAIDTKVIDIHALLEKLQHTEASLVCEILRERISNDKSAFEVLDNIDVKNEGIMGKLDYDLCNKLYFYANKDDYKEKEFFYKKCVLLGKNLLEVGENGYKDLKKELEDLGEKIVELRTMPDTPKKRQIRAIIKQQIIGYKKLLTRFPDDCILKYLPIGSVIAKFNNVFHGKISSVQSLQSGEEFSGTYSDEIQRLKPLPSLADLSKQETINRDDAASRTTDEVTNEVLKLIFKRLSETKSDDKLVIYRGMDGTEALPILRYFNSDGAANLEEQITNNTFNRHTDILEFGKHYGEKEQVIRYGTIRVTENNFTNVILEFTLKPGAKKLLFSKLLLALPGNMTPEKVGGSKVGFTPASSEEGTSPGYIGLKSETLKDNKGKETGKTYSLGVAQGFDSRLALQTLIESVKVVRLLYK